MVKNLFFGILLIFPCILVIHGQAIEGLKNPKFKAIKLPQIGRDKLGPEMDADDKIKKFVQNLTSDIGKMIEKKGTTVPVGETYEPLKYRKEIVTGVLFFVKVSMNSNKSFWHLRIYENKKGQVLISNVDGPKKENDPIERFR